VARVRALLRRIERSPASPSAAVTVGEIEIDPGSRRVRRDGEEVYLTPTEFDLLYALATRPGVVLTRDRLLADVWGYREAFGARTVDSHVRALRRKLGADVIRTAQGVGYALEVER
jgi:DNA-binding response OmpR family regulator